MPTGPTGRRDESVQFSLKELLELEDQRLEEQAREREAREAAAAREREEAERRRRDEAAAQTRAEEDARERQRRAELEDLARREAMQKAIVEQSRLEVEVRARTEERERERHHEIEIERLRSASKKGSSLGALIGASAIGGGVMLIVALAIQFGVQKPASERLVRELQQSVTAADQRADELARQLDEQRRLVGERDRQLAEARTEIAALSIKKAAPPPTTNKLDRWLPASKTAPTPPKDPKTGPEKDCLAGDPMCFSLKTGR